MFFLYNVIVVVAGFVLKVVAVFSPKIKLFTEGRKSVFDTLASKVSVHDKTIWFHAASLGEYEQGLPVIEQVKTAYPDHKIILTFFSPSGYEVRKNNIVADVTVYLPLDTRKNAERFVRAVNPEIAFFIKYEFWPNYLNALKDRGTRTYLISGIFRENQPFFKWYGGLQRSGLETFDHFFVQNSSSKELLHRLGKTNVTVSGDTRFDRVAAIVNQNNSLAFIEKFKDGKITVVIGSSWPADEKLLVEYINGSQHSKFIIAPHNIHQEQIQKLRESLSGRTVLYSEMENKNLSEYGVFIIDTVGILTKIYSYADIAYVGGGFGSPGVHNILEPATFGVPIVIGPNYSHFAEATALVQMGGCISIDSQATLYDAFQNLIFNEDIRAEKGAICATFVQMNKNATSIIMKHLSA